MPWGGGGQKKLENVEAEANTGTLFTAQINQ